MDITNYSLCTKGWKLYDYVDYWENRALLEDDCKPCYEEALDQFQEHRENCPRCGYLEDFNPT